MFDCLVRERIASRLRRIKGYVGRRRRFSKGVLYNGKPGYQPLEENCLTAILWRVLNKGKPGYQPKG